MIKQFIRKHLVDFNNYSVSGIKPPIELNANESPFNIFNVLNEEINLDLNSYMSNKYPDPVSTRLRESLAKYNNVNIENIICGNGSDEIITMITTTFIDAQDGILTHSPSFDMYKISAGIANAKFYQVNDLPNFVVDVDKIIEYANKYNPKLIYLCTPNNPTGYVIPESDIIKVIESTNSIVVIDEAYYDFDGQTSCDLIEKYENILILRTLSKAFGLAGLRLGYAIGSKAIIDVLYKVKQPYNLNSLSQQIGVTVLNNLDRINGFIQEIIDNRNILYEKLISIESIEVFPSKSNFLLIRTDKSQLINVYLLKQGILVKYYGTEGVLSNCLRITVGNKDINEIVYNSFKEVLEK